MKTVAAFSVLVLCLAHVAVAVVGEHTVEDRVRIMTSEGEPWAERGEAEDRLKESDAESVLSALLPHVSRGMPSLPVWNSLGREHDREAPIEWQIFYAVDRSWRHHLRGAPSEELGALLLELLSRADTAFGRQRVLFDLSRHWHPGAEEPLGGLALDAGQEFIVRIAAGYDLMLHRGEAYHGSFLDLASRSSGNERREWWNLLVDPRHKSLTGVDPAVVRLGFDILSEEMDTNPDRVHGAYFVVCNLGNYLDREFKPDQRAGKYRGRHGLMDVFFADTVENALAWWAEHRCDYEPTSAPTGPPANPR